MLGYWLEALEAEEYDCLLAYCYSTTVIILRHHTGFHS